MKDYRLGRIKRGEIIKTGDDIGLDEEAYASLLANTRDETEEAIHLAAIQLGGQRCLVDAPETAKLAEVWIAVIPIEKRRLGFSETCSDEERFIFYRRLFQFAKHKYNESCKSGS